MKTTLFGVLLLVMGWMMGCAQGTTAQETPRQPAATWWERDIAAGDPLAGLGRVMGNPLEWRLRSGQFVMEEEPSPLAAGRLYANANAPVVTAGPGPVLVLERPAPLGQGASVRALVRLHAPGSVASFYVGGKDEAQRGLSITLATGVPNDEHIACYVYQNGKPLHDLAALNAGLDWLSPWQNTLNYYVRGYAQAMPGWQEQYRMLIEQAMARLPGENEKWLAVRIDVAPGQVRFWVDDRLVGIKEDPTISGEGQLRVEMSPGAQLAEYRLEPLASVAGFLPVELSGYANARVFLGGHGLQRNSLPPAGSPVRVGGVPFVFAGVNNEGNDHIDVGQSLFRQANGSGYFQAGYRGGRWAGGLIRDPARIQLRIPQGFYNRLYVIAACDDERDSLPLFSAQFFRSEAGFSHTVEAGVPLATASAAPAQGVAPLAVTLEGGKKANLYLVEIPVDPAIFSSFADLDIIEVELTKKVQQYRSYPDPISYGFHGGGLPSAVHIYALTLGRAPVEFTVKADQFGHVWTAPAVPAYTFTVRNQSSEAQSGKLTVVTKSYDGSEKTQQERPLAIPAGKSVDVKVNVPVQLNGYHDVIATMTLAGGEWTEQRSLVRLAADTRSARYTPGKGAMFGYWAYHGGHHTPKSDHIVRLMTIAGARNPMHYIANLGPETQQLIEKHWGKGQTTAYYVTPLPWAAEGAPPEKVAELKAQILKAVDDWEKNVPAQFKPDNVQFFAEPHISPRLTAGNFPEYWGDPPFVYTDEENQRLKMFFETARLAAQIVRKEFPDRKVLIPWGDPGFVIPLLRAGFPKELIDGCGIDVPNFERLPEMQLRDNAVHRLYELREEFRKAGIEKPVLQTCEGTFVPTEPGACTWREQMDIYNRWNLIDMAYGVDRFYSGWFAFDCGNYYGSEHYGGCGIQRRIPYCDPKPAYAAFATMTDQLNEANFATWHKTGSLTTYCLDFLGPKGHVYTLWNIRGKRPVTLTFAAEGNITVIDAMNNGKTIATKDKRITIETDPSVLYVRGGELVSAQVGAADNRDAQPHPQAVVVSDLGDGSWHATAEREPIYENNHWGFYPAWGRFHTDLVSVPEHGQVLRSILDPERTRELMPWYHILRPNKPVPLAGAPARLGLWVKGQSDWGRFIYILRDAKGERWISIGSKDDYNCDDVHSWSSFNFDGWRYLTFELPGHLGYDNFRKFGTTWWRSGAGAHVEVSSGVPSDAPSTSAEPGDNIVDLPLAVEGIILEQRSHILYVNDVQPVGGNEVQLGKLLVEYEQPQDASYAAVAQSRVRMPTPTGMPDLPNPIAIMTRDNPLPAPGGVTLTAPEHYYDGTRMHVHFAAVPGAAQHQLWVSAYPDGRGAVNLTPAGIKPDALVYGLRPGIKLYYWLTYSDEKKQNSKPSPVHMEVTVDNFKEK